MRPKAIKDLTQLDDDHLFEQLSVGMTQCLRNAVNLWRDARYLERAERVQTFRITQFFVSEEAAKFHILMDAARCPREPGDRFSRQLGNFVQHLAKGIYSEYYTWGFRHLRDADRWFRQMRETFFLDGPNDIDWIFRNRIFSAREEAIYVDYVATDDEPYWHRPEPARMRLLLDNSMPRALQVGLALHGAGVSSSAALRAVAERWRTAAVQNVHSLRDLWEINRGTLVLLEERGLLRLRPERTLRTIMEDWLLPLYDLDLSPIDVDLATLREIQRSWSPWDYW